MESGPRNGFSRVSSKDGNLPSRPSSTTEVEAFLNKLATTPANTAAGKRGRLIFAMDATASRQPSWDHASRIQGEMFSATSDLGGLEIQLVHYRGFGEFKASPWLTESNALLKMMTSTFCLAGETQIAKVLKHAVNETRTNRVNALVFVGDSIEEDVDKLGAIAGELGLLGVPAFMFHEGDNPLAAFAFQQIARLTNGACCRFDASSAKVLRELLGAVAVFAAGGRPALEDLAKRQGGEALRIAHQVRGS